MSLLLFVKVLLTVKQLVNLKQRHYYTDRPFDRSAVEKLYQHGNYLLNRYTDFLKRRQIETPNFSDSENEKASSRTLYALYRELCDFGLEDFAKKMQREYSPK